MSPPRSETVTAARHASSRSRLLDHVTLPVELRSSERVQLGCRFLAASGDGPHLATFCHACGVIRLHGSCNATAGAPHLAEGAAEVEHAGDALPRPRGDLSRITWLIDVCLTSSACFQALPLVHSPEVIAGIFRRDLSRSPGSTRPVLRCSCIAKRSTCRWSHAPLRPAVSSRLTN
jgi:hypothetical protein